jgi:hypothetical protein
VQVCHGPEHPLDAEDGDDDRMEDDGVDADRSAMAECGARGETKESASPTRSQQIDAAC